jgi:hypothetical protein
MTYDLRRLRLHGVIARVPRSFRYVVTPDGMRLACGLSRIYLRLLQPNWTDLLVDTNLLPAPLRTALLQLDTALRQLHAETLDPDRDAA